MRFVFFCALFVVFSSTLFAQFGYVDASFENRSFYPGEKVPLTLTIQNDGEEVFSDARVLVQLAKDRGSDSSVPAFFVSEQAFGSVALTPRSTGFVSGEFYLPGNLPEGSYSLFFYLLDGRRGVLGRVESFQPGLVKKIRVNSTSLDYAWVEPNATLKFYVSDSGPSNFVNSSKVTGSVSLYSLGEAKNGLSLRVSAKNVDGIVESENVIAFSPLYASSTSVVYSVATPNGAGNYFLDFELSEDGVVKSFYRLPFTVEGTFTEITSLYSSTESLIEGSEFKIGYSFSGFSSPSETLKAILSVSGDGAQVFSKTIPFEFSSAGGFSDVSSFVPVSSFFQANVSLAVFDEKKMLDSYSILLFKEKYSGVSYPKNLSVEFLDLGVDGSEIVGRPILSSVSKAKFYSSGFNGVLCTSSTILVSSNTGSFTLFTGKISNNDEKSFNALQKIPSGVYQFKLLCDNSFDLHKNSLNFEKVVCVNSCVNGFEGVNAGNGVSSSQNFNSSVSIVPTFTNPTSSLFGGVGVFEMAALVLFILLALFAVFLWRKNS